jgi:hypothetical protein
MAAYEPMDYQLTGFAEPEDTEMCMGSADEPIDMTERQEHRNREAAESDNEYEDEDEIPPVPPPLVRQNATTGPVGRGLPLREQELRYIAEHGLVDFCDGAIVTAILMDADYLLAQLTYLRR